MLDYGFSFFLIALNEHTVIAHEQEKSMAVAVRMGSHADKDEWKKYIRAK